MVPHMVHLQDVVKLHTFVLGHLGALLLACFGFDLRFALVAFDLVSASIWCEGVGVGVGARGGSTWAGGDYLRGALGWERRANLRTTNKARSHTHTQAQATQPLHRGPPTPIPTAFQHTAVVRAVHDDVVVVAALADLPAVLTTAAAAGTAVDAELAPVKCAGWPPTGAPVPAGWRILLRMYKGMSVAVWGWRQLEREGSGWEAASNQEGAVRLCPAPPERRTLGVRPAGRRRRHAVGCSMRSTCSLPVRLLPLAISLLFGTKTISDSTSVASLTEGLPGLDPLEGGREDHLRGRPASGPCCTV